MSRTCNLSAGQMARMGDNELLPVVMTDGLPAPFNSRATKDELESEVQNLRVILSKLRRVMIASCAGHMLEQVAINASDEETAEFIRRLT